MCGFSFLTENGLIPAGAGNMATSFAPAASARAHPRRCGEHFMKLLIVETMLGSSPQVRGTSHPSRSQHPQLGLIPAGAGNMLSPRGGGPYLRAHPRRCGEHLPFCLANERCRGSSPQVRGTCCNRVPRTDRTGLIPAGAGNIPGLRRE